jgi:hypothetical protein
MKTFERIYAEIVEKLVQSGFTKSSAEALIDEMLDAYPYTNY